MKERKTKLELAKGSIQQDLLEAPETELRLAQDSRELIIVILAHLNEPVLDVDVLGKILGLVKEFTGFEAIGIRLREDEDFPYAVAAGFSNDFIATENSLCCRTEYGEIVRDSNGYPVLECICGEVIRGRTDPSLPFFTPGGSFWTNSRTELLAVCRQQKWEFWVAELSESFGPG
jgi:hypothetical protein